MLLVPSITAMQRRMIERWHQTDIDNPYAGFLNIACHQCALNFRLWHEEDRARDPEVTDQVIAAVKRSIDRLNQQRNDWIEKMDDWIAASLVRAHVEPPADARMNSETPGSVIDRLAILALRVFHLREQQRRRDITGAQRSSLVRKLVVCQHQHADLETALIELLDDIWAGRKRHRKYCQFKMYNDPALNPHIYRARVRQAA